MHLFIHLRNFTYVWIIRVLAISCFNQSHDERVYLISYHCYYYTNDKKEKKPGFCGITEEIIISHNSRHDVAPFDVVPKQ